MIDNYPPGAANDSFAPYNEPLMKEVTFEVGIELGTMITIEESNNKDIKTQIADAIIEKLKIDNDEVVLNNFYIYNKK